MKWRRKRKMLLVSERYLSNRSGDRNCIHCNTQIYILNTSQFYNLSLRVIACTIVTGAVRLSVMGAHPSSLPTHHPSLNTSEYEASALSRDATITDIPRRFALCRNSLTLLVAGGDAEDGDAAWAAARVSLAMSGAAACFPEPANSYCQWTSALTEKEKSATTAGGGYGVISTPSHNELYRMAVRWRNNFLWRDL